MRKTRVKLLRAHFTLFILRLINDTKPVEFSTLRFDFSNGKLVVYYTVYSIDMIESS